MTKKNMNVPVVVFIYKRPELTREIFNILKDVKPPKLFVFADGPQVAEETELCNQARAVFETVDWTEDVYRDYLPTNIGLGKRITSGLDYVFSQVDRAIILEDDCIPNEHFFSFCEEMLEHYKDNENILHINGTNILADNSVLKNYEYSYFFSQFSIPWGWASWARAWNKFNADYTTFKHHREDVLSMLSKENVPKFDTVFSSCEHFVDAWDNQWLSDILFNKGLVITPKSNLITNKGNDVHSSYMPEFSNFSNIQLQQLGEIKHPPLPLDKTINNACENGFVQIINDFKYYNGNKQKELSNTREILNFLNPVKIEKDYTFDEVKEFIVKNLPPYTALPLDFYNSVLDFFPKYSKLEVGAWVEVGVWKGGGALFLRSLMNELEINQELFLYDTFGEIPIKNLTHPKDLDFLNGFGVQKPESHEVSYFSKITSFFKSKQSNVQNRYLKEVETLFSRFELNKNVHFIPSDVHTLSENQIPENIAFLFIDVDFYEPIYKSLDLFYDKLMSGGVLVIDDYYMNFLNCKEAVDDFFKNRNIDLKPISEKFSSFAIKIIKP